ncbi:MAG: putative toxin-antitoxin system toxin component, PIN family [Gammaproteobacteria bacterium]|nr:putative toxin-antitoxin system toxin component, PIN family [Gammaproteobacteria bacterium]
MPTRAERLVADTNVLISAALRSDTPPRQVLDAVQRAGGVLVFSDETFAEVHDRLSKPKFDRYATHESRGAFLGHLVAVSEWVSISQAKLGCRDPDDDKLLETALAGQATCLVTGDRDLLDMNPFRSIPIVDPTTFLAER